jgi:hypothetical protein
VARTEIEHATEPDGPSIWAVRPIAVRADSDTMDDLRIAAGRGDPDGTGENTADN